MKMHDLFPSNWLKKEDVPGPITAVIRSITQEEIKGDKGNELKAVIHFVGTLKSMVLNKGNASILADAFGDDSTAWHGKTVEVYVDPNVMFAGKRIGGLRIRIPTSGSANVVAGVITGWSWTQAQTEAAKVGISKDQLVAQLKQSGCPGWSPKYTSIVQGMLIEAQAPVESFDNPDADPIDHGYNIPF